MSKQTKPKLRSMKAINQAGLEFFHKIWYERTLMSLDRQKIGDETIDPKTEKEMLTRMKLVEKIYGGKKTLSKPYADFDWGMMNGKLSALRWVLGWDWDMLDT